EGNLIYSAQWIDHNKIGITDKLKVILKNPGVIPFMGRSILPAPAEATNVKVEGSKLKWSTTGNVRSVVYYFSDLTKEGVVLAITDKKELDITSAGHYSVSTIDAENKESKPTKPVEKK